jgi:hypothetical protein
MYDLRYEKLRKMYKTVAEDTKITKVRVKQNESYILIICSGKLNEAF